MQKFKLISIEFIIVLFICNFTACSISNNKSTNLQTQNQSTSSSLNTKRIDFNKFENSQSSGIENEDVSSHNILIINNTNKTFKSLYISPERQCQFSKDFLLNNSDINTNKKAKITFKTSENCKYWDVKITDDQNCEYIWEKIDLFNISELELTINDSVPEANCK